MAWWLRLRALASSASPLWFWLAGASAVLGVAGLLAVPWLLVRIPSDYFTAERRRRFAPRSTPARELRWLGLALKNLLGALLLVAGIAMLVLPGQGVLTILLALAWMDFPGKYRLERWLVSRGPTLRTINRIRRARGCEPLQSPHAAGG